MSPLSFNLLGKVFAILYTQPLVSSVKPTLLEKCIAVLARKWAQQILLHASICKFNGLRRHGVKFYTFYVSHLHLSRLSALHLQKVVLKTQDRTNHSALLTFDKLELTKIGQPK